VLDSVVSPACCLVTRNMLVLLFHTESVRAQSHEIRERGREIGNNVRVSRLHLNANRFDLNRVLILRRLGNAITSAHVV
jgi:DNA anti-recombination protein RmuC